MSWATLRRRVLWLMGCALFMAVAWSGLPALVRLPGSLQDESAGTLDLLDCNGETLARFASTNARIHRPISLAAMGAHLPEVIVQLEDKRFYHHHGVDFISLAGAVARNFRQGRAVSGASTISQQVIKLGTERLHRSLGAKAYEILASRRLERDWSKDRILEYYMNHAPFGNRLTGVEAASQVYFGKSAAALTRAEAIFLCGFPQAPSRYNPWSHPEAAKRRYQISLRRLLEAGLLKPEELLSLQEPPRVGRYLTQNGAPHFCQAVRGRFPFLSGIVHTTLDSQIQWMSDRIAGSEVAALLDRGVQHVAVVVLENENGAVRAMVGSGNFGGPAGQINGSLIRRSAGSTVKPFVYAKAFEDQLLTPATLLPDTPDAMPRRFLDYTPTNFDGRFGGPVRVREALASSLNVPAVVVINRVGVERAYEDLTAAGITFNHDFRYYGAGLVLGNAEIQLTELTTAFSAFARGGVGVSYRYLEDEPVAYRQWISGETAFQIADILADDAARTRTFGLDNPLVFRGLRIPCKTGTSSSFRDSWCVGSTEQHTVGVWMGNFDGRPTQQVTAVAGAAKVFRRIIEYLLENGDRPLSSNPTGLDLHKVRICGLSGLLPCPASPKVSDEWFTTGSAPNKNSAAFFDSNPDGSLGIRLPFEYAAWCESAHNWMGARVGAQEDGLEILNPRNGSVFQLVPYLSPAQQMIALEGVSAFAGSLRWFINGEELTLSGGRCFWQLRVGKHVAELRCGKSAKRVSFEVIR